MTHGHKLRRFLDHKAAGAPYVLAADHPSVRAGRTLFLARTQDPRAAQRLLKHGRENRKIGDRVTKGAWKGMPIYTLTLEERATCPSTCRLWLSCYGNKMNWSERLAHGAVLEQMLGRELAYLQAMHANGFVVRLHVLGDFYSVGYVKHWLAWLRRFPALHVYGYTAWREDTEIGALLAAARTRFWERFAIRTSDGLRGPRAVVVRNPADIGRSILCPAQTDRTECCGTCGLCWGTRRDIAFLEH